MEQKSDGNIEEKLTPILTELIQDKVVEDIGTVEVSQQFADCYRVEDGDKNA